MVAGYSKDEGSYCLGAEEIKKSNAESDQKIEELKSSLLQVENKLYGYGWEVVLEGL